MTCRTSTTVAPADTMPAWFAPLPGLALCLLGTLAAMGVGAFVPVLPPLLLAILLGTALANLVELPKIFAPGIALAAKHLLRLGIVLLGLSIALPHILSLGWGVLLTVCAVVTAGMAVTVWLGRRLGVDEHLTLLIAAGFSICGASAVAGAQTVVRAARATVVAALTLVVLFGTLAIPLFPALAGALGMAPEVAGAWIGASVHEVAQVVAAAGVIDGPDSAVMQYAVVVKLARVVLLVGVIAALGVYVRRRGLAPQDGEEDADPARRPPLIPGFVLGFLAMVVLATADAAFGFLPAAVLDVTATLQTLFLTMAMFALGCGVKFADLRNVGWRPLVLGLSTSVTVAAVGAVGVSLSLAG